MNRSIKIIVAVFSLLFFKAEAQKLELKWKTDTLFAGTRISIVR